MDITVEKDGKLEQYTMIDNWEDVTVEQYARLVKYMDLNGAQRSLHTIALMTDIPKHVVKKLDVVSLGQMLQLITKMQQEETKTYRHIIKIDGVEYGMIPDFSAITLGEYADLETFITNDVISNLTNIAAVLFREIKSKDGDYYTIGAYDLEGAKKRAKLFKKMSAGQVQAALVFFWTLGSGLLASMALSSEMALKEMAES